MSGAGVPGLDATFAALSDPTRRAVVELLRREPLRASDIAEQLETSRPAMSRHLRVLRQCGLVAEEGVADDARVRVFRLQQRPFTELRDWVADVEGFWTDQLASFKAHAERRGRERT